MRQEAIVPTKVTLFKYTLFSIIFAVITLVTIILPAEYDIDPTGVGYALGLTVFNEVTKVEATGTVEHIDIIVPAQSGVEYKFTMQQHQKLTYRWMSDGVALYFDLHGEPKDNTTGYFESYAIATLTGMEGSFTTPFQGSHGWYWKNTSNTPVTIQLTVKGEYANHSLK